MTKNEVWTEKHVFRKKFLVVHRDDHHMTMYLVQDSTCEKEKDKKRNESRAKFLV